MKKHLFLLTCLLAFIACNNKKVSNEQTPNVIVDTITDAKTDLRMPQIFHGWSFGVSKAELDRDGSIKKWGKLKADTTKYALYFDISLITIFDDSTQFHYIEEYLGKSEEAGATWYDIATILDADTLLGYVSFKYQGDSISELYIDYPNTVLFYPLKTFMQQEELDEHLSKYKKVAK